MHTRSLHLLVYQNTYRNTHTHTHTHTHIHIHIQKKTHKHKHTHKINLPLHLPLQLAHPILEALKGSSSEWLRDLLLAFNEGHINKFEAMKAQWSTQPDLLAKENQLREKIRLLCLMEVCVCVCVCVCVFWESCFFWRGY